jgi:hypothetical protein
MAPQTESKLKKDHRISHGVRDRQYLNAHTGAGVNANRPFNARPNSLVRDTYIPRYHGNQIGNRRHARITTPGERLLEHLKFHDDRRQISRAQDSSDGIAKLQDHCSHDKLRDGISRGMADQHHQNQGSVATRTATTVISFDKYRNLGRQNDAANPTAFRSNTCTNQHSNAHQSLLEPQNHTYFVPPAPGPDISFLDNYNRILNIRNSQYSPISVKKQQTKLYKGSDTVKRAFTNPNLRAILSGKPWPTQRKKAAAEKPILKMGIKREYK